MPRIIIQQSDDVRSGFHDFTLDVRALNLQPVSEEILRQSLTDNSVDSIQGGGRIVPENLDSLIVSELINAPEVDYDECTELLFSLANDAISKFRSYLNEEELMNVAQYHRRDIAKFIYAQMMEPEHFYCDVAEFGEPIVRPFTQIEPHNLAKYAADTIHDYTETITPTRLIPSKIFTGFRKACHDKYKFDSKTEKDFAAILEKDDAVLKWLRPAKSQFCIYWKHNSLRYIPDFVVETAEAIYMVETKKQSDIETVDVQEKAAAAIEYCKNASAYTAKHQGKPWKYLIIPHNAVLANMGLATLAIKFGHE